VETKQKFNYKHLITYAILVPSTISIYFLFDLVFSNSKNLTVLFNFKSLLTLLIYFAITFAFAGISLYFNKTLIEKFITSFILTIPILFLKLNFDQLIISIISIILTFFFTGVLIKNNKQKYLKPNVSEQIIKSYKSTTILLNLSLTFIFFSQVSLLTFETWVNKINNVLAPVTTSVTKQIEKSLFPQAQFIPDPQKLSSIVKGEQLDSILLELGIDDLSKAGNILSINELGIDKIESNNTKRALEIPSPTDIIKAQIETLLEPYSEFIPIVISILAFINYQVLINVALLTTSIFIPIFVYLLKLTKIINIKVETKEVEIYEI